MNSERWGLFTWKLIFSLVTSTSVTLEPHPSDRSCTAEHWGTRWKRPGGQWFITARHTVQSPWKAGVLLRGEIASPCQTLQIISPFSPEDLKAADRSKRIGMDTWPFSIARRKSLTRKNSTCSTRLCKGREEGLEEFRAICKTNTAASAQPVQLASIAITHGHAKGVTSSLARTRCHLISCSKGDIQNEYPEGFLVDAERLTPL